MSKLTDKLDALYEAACDARGGLLEDWKDEIATARNLAYRDDYRLGLRSARWGLVCELLAIFGTSAILLAAVVCSWKLLVFLSGPLLIMVGLRAGRRSA
jgi:hypothetical protein